MASPKIVIVTGANSGIGYETVKCLLQSSQLYHIYFCSRSIDKGQAALDAVLAECPSSKSTTSLLELDLTSDESIEAAYNTLKAAHDHIDILINNAGATFDIAHLRHQVSLRESFTSAYDVNVAGTHVLTHTLMPVLLKSPDPRLIFVAGLSNLSQASRSYFPTPPLAAGWPKVLDFETIGYRCSKTALNMLMLDWNHKLKADGVKVWAVGPGMLATNLGDMKAKAVEMGCGHPEAGGRVLVGVVEGERDGDVGRIVCKDGGVIEF